MNVLVIGANGKVAKHAIKEFGELPDFHVKAMIRKEEQVDTMKQLGAEPVVADLEQDFSHAFENVDAVIFAAGSGAHTGPDQTTAIDEKGAIKSMDLAVEKGVKRYVIVSTVGADNPEIGPASLRHYLNAKGRADEHLMGSSLDYTIVRPSRLTNDDSTGQVTLLTKLSDYSGSIPRVDVGKVLVECLKQENTIGKTFELLGGDTPIEEAVSKI